MLSESVITKVFDAFVSRVSILKPNGSDHHLERNVQWTGAHFCKLHIMYHADAATTHFLHQ